MRHRPRARRRRGPLDRGAQPGSCALRIAHEATHAALASLHERAHHLLAIGDLDDVDSGRAALRGVDALLSCADDPRRVDWETRAIDTAARAGVRRVVRLVVRLSTLGPAPGAPVAFWDWHGRSTTISPPARSSG